MIEQSRQQRSIFRSHRIAGLGILAFAFGANAWGSTDDLTDYPLPTLVPLRGMHVEWVAEHMVMNGVPMSIRAFVSTQSVEQVLDAYAHRWKSKGLAQIARSQHADEKGIGMEYRGHYYTVQGHALPVGSEGTLTVSQSLSDAKPNTDSDFPVVPGSQVISKIDSRDFGQRAETLVFTNSQSVVSNEAYLAAALRRDGWVRQDFSKDSTPGQRVLNFQKGDQLCQISIVGGRPGGSQNTQMLVNWIKGK